MGVRPRGVEAADAPRWYILLIILAFLVLLGRLFYLQVVQHRAHFKASLDNILRSVPIAPPRGTVYDRAGKPLAFSKQTFGLLYIPPANLGSYMPDAEQERVLGLVDRHCDYLVQTGWKDNPAKRGARLPCNPRQELIQANQPPELSACLERLKGDVPSAPAVETFRASLAPPPEGGLGPVGVIGPLGQTGKAQDYTAAWNTVEAYITARGLDGDFRGDLQRLEQRALTPLASQREAPEPGDLSKTLHQLYADEVTLAGAYADRAALAGQDLGSLRLADIVALAAYLKQPYEELMRHLNVARGQVYGHQPLMVVDELTDDQKLYIGEHNADFPHVIIEEYSFRREYPLGNATTHLLGYTGPATQAQIDKGYDPEELSGKEGVERQFEDKLRGELGRRDMEIDRQGIFKNEANVVPPKRGSDLYLSIDSGTQQAAHDILVQTMNGDSGITGGAIIVNALGPENRGEILAMTSGPSYDPSKFDQPGYYSGLLRNSRMPLLNRCIGLAYPPGSTFKLVTLTTALQLGTINMNTSFYCSGYKEIGKYHQRFYCHVRSGHGMLATPDALAQSCDVFFYDVGSMLPDPPQNLHDFALQFGYGQPTDIALPGEVKGTVPDADWKWKHFAWAYNKTHNHQDQAWYDGDTLNYSIGQGFLLVTPLQDLWAASTIAWDGMHYPPRLVVASSGAQGMTPTEMDQGTATGLDPHVLDEVKSAMRHTASDPKGTCQRLNFAPGMQVCAKTGTAEASHNKNDYSWVVGFYPENNPRYGFICFFEHGGESKLAVDSAVQLLKYLKEHDPLARAKPGDKPGPGKGAAK